ncbi:GCG_CRPN prefix-to-repeats domain-containing protein [Methylorubrum zatmanii]|uniref:GCG_CRPN prefix-to-repeats domain-containing protein n=1 Tax=Methylorubrum zatmanii TaxID=29429 RepID=A0ABW1WTF6_9HYPH|nr:hypothetical protein [Methylorubrum zatmanii]MBD8907964.1 hypothetical protein [Methylorubrum zatmanii]
MIGKIAIPLALAAGLLTTASDAEARDGCGLGFHRGYYGWCRPNFGYRPYVYGPVYHRFGYRPWGGYRWRYGYHWHRRFAWHGGYRWGGFRHAGWHGGWHRRW